MDEGDVEAAIDAGATTSREIADHASVDPSTARRQLKQLANDGSARVSREPAPEGNGYVYTIQTADPQGSGGEMPLLGDRDYEWGARVPSAGATEYVQVNRELDKIEAALEHRHDTGKLPRFRLTGPPGTGKTTVAKSLAAKRQWPFFTVQVTASLRDSELIGTPHLIGGESVFVDGPLTKAVLCSQSRPVVVVLDEINRAPFDRKSSLQAFLDHRCQVTIELRGGEVIEGDAMNLVTVATMNEGEEYETFPIDPAERRRHGKTIPIPYLGLENPGEEQLIITERAPVSDDLAAALVEAANEVRQMATDPTSRIEKGISPSELIKWAQAIVEYRHANVSNPVHEAARDEIIAPHYNDEVADDVLAVLLDAVARLAGV